MTVNWNRAKPEAKPEAMPEVLSARSLRTGIVTRFKQCAIRMTEEEYQQLIRNAIQSGYKSVSGYARARLGVSE